MHLAGSYPIPAAYSTALYFHALIFTLLGVIGIYGYAILLSLEMMLHLNNLQSCSIIPEATWPYPCIPDTARSTSPSEFQRWRLFADDDQP